MSCASGPLPRAPGGKSPTVGGRGLPPIFSPRSSMSITNTKGLLNMPGQNNCFLNSAVQVLWHLDIFRRSFRELSGHACMEESCIFCALKELFAQFEYSQESALPPDALRRALAETFCDQRRFQLGFMDDAAECFENILMRIHFHIANNESEDMCSATHCIPHQRFAMTLVEQTVCHSCGATSEPLPFTQMVHYVPSSALCSQAKLMKEKNDEIPGFSELLRRAGGLGDLRDCPSSCGAVIQIRKTLMNRPEIVSIGLVWDSERPTLEHITDVFKTIGMSLKLQDVFHSVVDSRWASNAMHQLVGIVTYYGKHYSTFFFHTKLRVWIYFDDAAVREIGPKWEQVVEKCCRGHFQPLLLLYSNPHGSPVVTSTAPRAVTGVTGHKKSALDKPCRPFQSPPQTTQRRAVTPNPEASCDLNANVQPRRAVTPSGELLWCEDNNNASDRNSSKKTFRDNLDAVKPEPSIQYHPSCYSSQKAYSGISILQGKAKLAPPTRLCVSNGQSSGFYKENGHQELHRTAFSPRSSSSSIDDVHQPLRQDMSRSIPNGKSDQSQDSAFSEDGSQTYISRKTVENVLKLQRQKSMNSKHGHVFVGQRNSSSSLESLDNVFLREKGVLGLKLDIPDSANVARRRDSGNWSGDRNSASSSSTTSLDNPYFYVVGNKRPLNSRSGSRPGVVENGSITDTGYDSFSLSSSDSYPSAITSSPSKSGLGKIPEHMQAGFKPYDLSQLQYCLKDLRGPDNFLCGFKNECDKLCAEADIFVAKSVERENAGDMSMAALLSDTAAAKARAAMDIPYSNTQSLAMAKMKHSMCLIRSSNLHKKLKEAEDALRRKQKEESQQVSNDSSSSKNDGKDSYQKSGEDSSRDVSEDAKNSDKNIEIYATLPKKTLKKKGALSSFVDSLTGDDSSDEKNTSKSSEERSPKEEKSVKSPGSKKKSRSSTKSSYKDSDLSDYSSEWETTKKSSLYRTYSGPTSSKKEPSSDSNQSFTEHTAKKQHKIRRKLMGGFMRRKNRSLPDLREGQDSGSETVRSYDDCIFNQTPLTTRKQNGFKSRNQGPPVQSISIMSDATKVLKSVTRSQTPPPYKPPPPISNNSYGNQSPTKVIQEPVKSPVSRSGSSGRNDGSVDKSHPHPHHHHHHHPPLCRDPKSPRSAPGGYSELPRNSAVWLKELQMKQEEINQRRKLQEEREKWVQDRSPGRDLKYDCTSRPEHNQNTCSKIVNNNVEKHHKQNASPTKKMAEGFQDKTCTKQESLNQKTVRDLKSKFEVVPHTSPQSGSEQSSLRTSDGAIMESNNKSLSNDSEGDVKSNTQRVNQNSSVKDSPTHHLSLGRRCSSNLTPEMIKHYSQVTSASRHLELPNAKHCSPLTSPFCSPDSDRSYSQQYSSHSTSGCIYNPHLTDAQLTNVLRIGNNRTSFRSPSLDSTDCHAHNHSRLPHEASPFSESKRPEKPPDYETAIQRLELLRGDRSFVKFCSNSNCANFEAMLLEAKRRRGPKKCVTFSDKVVLVACAGDEDNDFIPNPLLERVYKQHLMQKLPLENLSANGNEIHHHASSIPKDTSTSTSSIPSPKNSASASVANSTSLTNSTGSPSANPSPSSITNCSTCPSRSSATVPITNTSSTAISNSMTCPSRNCGGTPVPNTPSSATTNYVVCPPRNSAASPITNSSSSSSPNATMTACSSRNSSTSAITNLTSCSITVSSPSRNTANPLANSQSSPATNPISSPTVKASNESEKQLLSGNPSSCHLCHKKTVESPNLYCPDCAFYMSRFQQK